MYFKYFMKIFNVIVKKIEKKKTKHTVKKSVYY